MPKKYIYIDYIYNYIYTDTSVICNYVCVNLLALGVKHLKMVVKFVNCLAGDVEEVTQRISVHQKIHQPSFD